jgi:hypothetical protein
MEYINRFDFLVIRFLRLLCGSISRMGLTLGYDELDLDEVCYCVFHACVNPNSCLIVALYTDRYALLYYEGYY